MEMVLKTAAIVLTIYVEEKALMSQKVIDVILYLAVVSCFKAQFTQPDFVTDFRKRKTIRCQ